MKDSSGWDFLCLIIATIIMAGIGVIGVISEFVLKIGWAFGILLAVASTLSLLTNPSTPQTINLFLLILGLILIALSLILNYYSKCPAETADYSPEL